MLFFIAKALYCESPQLTHQERKNDGHVAKHFGTGAACTGHAGTKTQAAFVEKDRHRVISGTDPFGDPVFSS